MVSAYDLIAALKLEPEMRRWRRAGVRPRLWWRDDDACAPTPALDRLLSAALARPLALAVIPGPDLDLERLAARLAGARHVRVGQHGVDHVNKSPMGQPPSEYAGLATPVRMGGAILAAKARLVGAGLSPHFFTPPWNACQPGLSQALAVSGYGLLSAGPDKPADIALAYMSSDVDLLRWRGGPRFRGGVRIATSLAVALRRRRLAGDWDRPVGLLTHHLVHDEATWRYLDWMIGFADRHFDWTSIDGAAVAAVSKPVARVAA